MNKEVFLHQLRIRLSQLSADEIKKQLDYFSEIINDMMEDGVSEEDAVASFGDVNELAQGILKDMPIATLVKSKVKPKKGWTPTAIIIAIVGAPLWIPLLAAFVAVMLSVVLVIFVMIACIYICVGVLGISGLWLAIKSFTLFGSGFAYVLISIGSGLAFVGLCLLAFLLARIVTIGLIQLLKWIFHEMKGLFIKGGNENEEEY